MNAAIKSLPFEKIYYFSTLILAFTMPISRASISLFTVLLFLIWLIEGDFKRKFEQLKSSLLFKSLSLFILFTLGSILWSTDLSEALHIIRLYSYWLVIPVIATSIKIEQIQNILTAFLLGMLISEITAYGMYFNLWEINGHGAEYPSPFMMHIDYSIYMAFAAILLLNRLVSPRYTRQEKALMFVFFLTISGNLFISEGRSGQLSYLVGIFVTIFIHYRFTLKFLLTSIAISVIMFISAYELSPKFQTRLQAGIHDIQLMKEGNFNSSWGTRVAFTQMTFETLKRDPLFGIGIGDYKLESIKNIEQNYVHFDASVNAWLTSNHYHSQYLMVLVQTGLIGFSLFLLLLYSFYKLPIQDREIKEFSIIFVTVFFVGCLSEPLWMKQFTIILFTLFTGLFLVASLAKREKL